MVVALDEDVVESFESVVQVVGVGGEQEGSHLGMVDEVAVGLDCIVLDREGDDLECTYLDGGALGYRMVEVRFAVLLLDVVGSANGGVDGGGACYEVGDGACVVGVFVSEEAGRDVFCFWGQGSQDAVKRYSCFDEESLTVAYGEKVGVATGGGRDYL